MRGVSYHHVQCSHQHTESDDVVITSVATQCCSVCRCHRSLVISAGQSSDALQHINTSEYILVNNIEKHMTMTRQRAHSYSSSTLSSHSSESSNRTYASINSDSSTFSRVSFSSPTTWSVAPAEKQKTRSSSLVSIIKRLFRHRNKEAKGEPSKITKNNLNLLHTSSVSYHSETSLSSSSRRKSLQSPVYSLSSSSSSSTCPAGLYCVIEDFLTEYDLRLIEEEERARQIAEKSKQLL